MNWNRYSDTTAPNEREWVRDIWNAWFDGVFPPTPRAETPATEAPVDAVSGGNATDTLQTGQNDQNARCLYDGY